VTSAPDGGLPTTAGPAVLRWSGADQLPRPLRDQLFGAGAPFELTVEEVLGSPAEVFVQRPANLAALLDQCATRYPERVYLAFPEQTLTYREVARRVDQWAGMLATKYGVAAGDRVAIASANNLGYALALWAIARLGAISVGLNGWWSSAEFRFGIELTTPKLVLGDPPRLARLAEDGVDVGIPTLTFEDAEADLGAGEEGRWPAPATVSVSEDAPAIILFTSGTTGRPKAATLSHRNLLHFGQVNMLRGALGALMSGVTPDPSMQAATICNSPLFHVSGWVPLAGAAWTGAKLVFPPSGRWDPALHLKLSARHQVSSWSAVPTQLFALVHHPDLPSHDLVALRSVVSGGANMAPDLMATIHQQLPNVSIGTGYGMTETTGLGTGIAGPPYLANPTSVGGPIPTSEIRLRQPDGTPAVDGAIGEICLRSPSVFLGYWGDDASTNDVLDAERWYRTGDFGRIENGLVFLDGRGSDRIIRAGENISPLEIENRLVDHPGIDGAAVIGVDHPSLGQEVLALVVLGEGAALTEDEVRNWAAAELASFKVPRHVVFVDELPYTASGKVHRKELQETWAGLLTRQ
jgi:acyl-CoA synthetase (AMP-forming)/AMP-acid ligase II